MSIATGMPHTENGITVNFPDNNYFQFEGCNAYQNISSHGVKEMDFGWYDVNTNTCWLIELKGYHNPLNPNHQVVDLSSSIEMEKRLKELINKSIHSICMIETERAQTKNCMPFIINNQTAIKLVHVISVRQEQRSYLNFMQDSMRTAFQPFKAIFNVASIAIIDYTQAQRFFSWIQ